MRARMVRRDGLRRRGGRGRGVSGGSCCCCCGGCGDCGGGGGCRGGCRGGRGRRRIGACSRGSQRSPRCRRARCLDAESSNYNAKQKEPDRTPHRETVTKVPLVLTSRSSRTHCPVETATRARSRSACVAGGHGEPDRRPGIRCDVLASSDGNPATSGFLNRCASSILAGGIRELAAKRLFSPRGVECSSGGIRGVPELTSKAELATEFAE